MRRECGELREHVVEPLRAADVISPARQMAADDPGDGPVIFHDEHSVHGVPPSFLTVCIPFEHTIQAGKSQIPASPRSFGNGCGGPIQPRWAERGEGPRSFRSGGLLPCVSGICDHSAAGMQQSQSPVSAPSPVLEAIFSMETSASTVSLSSPTVTVMVAVTVATSPTFSGCV